MSFGSGNYTYALVDGWGTVPADWRWGWIVGVAVDAQNRVFVASRSQHPLAVFNTAGNVYFTDAVNHCLFKFNGIGPRSAAHSMG